MQLAHQLAEQYARRHPQQPLLLSALFAWHYAQEGAAALQQAGVTVKQHPLLDPGTPYQPSYDQLYPINALRNLAVSQAATPLVLCADGDFIFSEGLQELLLQPWVPRVLQLSHHQQRHVQDQAQQQKIKQAGTRQEDAAASACLQQQQQRQAPVMLVLPVFQCVLQQELPDSQPAAVPRTKQQLAQALAAGQVEPFQCGAFSPQQQPVDVSAWLAAGANPSMPAAGATASTMAITADAASAAAEAGDAAAAACVNAYEVEYCEYFEPQGVAVKQQLPLYDERFRGYGLNKVQHAWHCSRLGYSFKVLTDAFMVTAPHKHSSSWRPVPGTATDEAHMARISRVYEQFKAQVAADLPDAASS
ncbi:hypothetical protein COO60DRAFT_1633546 [Scenedesmus sp. NREL 46B-D3]|nr:hypothetical protein COO60DRAFT_1633546 [Scenedesmus sp. NREL 46B-D3]